jgi:two-component sensor histidine kinase
MNAETMTLRNEIQKDALKRWRDESDSLHPLEMIPFFRRFERSALRTFIYTIIFNCLIAAFFTLMALIFNRINSLENLGRAVGQNLIISNIIGFSWTGIVILLKPVIRRINEWPLPGVVAAYTVLGFFVTQAAFLALSYLPGFEDAQRWTRTSQWYVASFALAFVISLLLGFAWRARMNAYLRDAMIATEKARLQEIEKQAVQANLRALQAQIEPHFLFNTLANVTGLIHSQPDKAKQMLEQFIAYLRATLAATRDHETTIAADFETMKTFLSILQIRMGDRLKVRFDLPDDLRNAAIPPMLLQPLVENAIKHGLEPKMDGGEVALIAKRMGNKIAITVADTGLGFQNSASNGIGLKNVRERVKQIYGDAGSVSIEENQPCGTRITIAFEAA